MKGPAFAIFILAIGESKPWNILLFPLPLLPRHPGSPGMEEHTFVGDIRSKHGTRRAGKDWLMESEIRGRYILSVTHVINPVRSKIAWKLTNV